MAFTKRWKESWDLKSLTKDELFDVIVAVVIKQLEVDKEEVTFEADLPADFEADSVDVVAMLLYLEDMFKSTEGSTNTFVPTDKVGEIVLVEDLFDVMYEALLEMEIKMDPFVKITPNFNALEKQKKVGELYN